MPYVTLLGRFLYSLMFLMTPINHFMPATVAYASQSGVPMASVLVPLSGILAGLGGLSILLGYKAKLGAWLLVLFLIPVTLMLHNFWTVQDPMMRQFQMGMFMKNIAMLGAALMITQLGSGPLSLDSRRSASTM